MQIKMSIRHAMLPTALATVFTLAACGGGGGSSSSTTSSSGSSSSSATGSSSSQSYTTNNVTTSPYASSTAQVAALTLLNQQRQACGFATLNENSTLDQAAQNHATYMSDNSVISDTETSGKTGYTGATYSDRAVALGYPFGAGGDADAINMTFGSTTRTATQIGQALVYAWEAAVYHSTGLYAPVTEAGIGESTGTYSGVSVGFGDFTLADLQPISSGAPLTFPCQGTTGVYYQSVAESPMPPNVSSSGWGTPISVIGSPTDTIVLTSGTMTTNGVVTQLQLLDSANDPNKELPAYAASAYPASPLAASTTYAVAITGTDNGVTFSRNFTFTTASTLVY
jgi:hypothetical protein